MNLHKSEKAQEVENTEQLLKLSQDSERSEVREEPIIPCQVVTDCVDAGR